MPLDIKYFCCELKTGALAIAIFGFITALSFGPLFILIANNITEIKVMDTNKNDLTDSTTFLWDHEFLTICFICLMVFAILVCLSLAAAVYKDNYYYILPWLFFHLGANAFMVLVIFTYIFSFTAYEMFYWKADVLFSFTFYLLIQWYMWFAVLYYFFDLKKRSTATLRY